MESIWCLEHYFIPKCRFVELLWQLSVHALREVHQRTFADDVSSNSLPPVLTEASYQNAAALLLVTKVIPWIVALHYYDN